jgi:hypothetical protein
MNVDYRFFRRRRRARGQLNFFIIGLKRHFHPRLFWSRLAIEADTNWT